MDGVDSVHRTGIDRHRIMGSDSSMLKGLDKFEVTALVVATIGVIGGSVALYILATHV